MSGKSHRKPGVALSSFRSGVFEMAADFVDPIDVLNFAVRRVQALHRLIARVTDRVRDALIDGIVRCKTQHVSPRRVEDQFTKRDATQLLILV